MILFLPMSVVSLVLVYHPTALVYHPTVLVYHPTALVYHPTALVYHPTALVYHPTVLVYHPTVLVYHPTALVYHPTALSQKKVGRSSRFWHTSSWASLCLLTLYPTHPILDSFYLAIFSALMSHVFLNDWLHPSLFLFFYNAFFSIQTKWCTDSAIWLLHGWCHVKLLPSRRMFRVHHTIMHQLTVSFCMSGRAETGVRVSLCVCVCVVW